ncbi:hypothetical protein [Synechococcus elongatus]|uniref:hypothetical protein n=1 Tax=Synechococcus elongatus TaxID=32046 RepID=UPI0030CDC900
MIASRQWLQRASAGLLGLGLAAATNLPVSAATARCVVRLSGRTVFDNACDFRQFSGNGSFTINAFGNNTIASYSVISVSIVSPGVAEVRGLTFDGINSRWGVAQRSSRDNACWIDDDFQICAY